MLPPGVHQYFFLVDGVARASQGQRIVSKKPADGGLRVNVLDVEERLSPLFAHFALPRPEERWGRPPLSRLGLGHLRRKDSSGADVAAAAAAEAVSKRKPYPPGLGEAMTATDAA